MKAVRNVAGGVVLAVIAALLLISAQSPAGTAILAPLGQSAAATGRTLRANVPGLGLVAHVAGNPLALALVLLGTFAAAVLLVPAARAGRGMGIALALAAALAVVLYDPRIIGGGA